ncbi:MAG: ABC transporter ATP-binding protein [Pseudomonadota bacterium]
MTRPSVLTARGIRKTLGEGAGRVEALKGVSLTVHDRELTLLMGPSGSGKTTLLSILGCLLSADEGTLELDGEVLNGKSSEQLARVRRDHIGYVFQSYNLFPTLSAVENTALCLDVRGVGQAEALRRSQEALDAVGLTHRMNAYPRTMSGGEKQRVAIARALVGEPSIILADEPTSALDAENGRAVMQLLSDVARDRGRAVLAVTHDHRTEAFADRIVEIEDGMINGSRRPAHSETGATADLSNVTPLPTAGSKNPTSSEPRSPSPKNRRTGSSGKRRASKAKR